MFTAGTRPVDGTTQYLYGNPGNPFQLTASRATDNTLTTYSYDPSGNLFAFERAGTRYYVATDHLGTPKVVTDNGGTIVKQAEYDAWGVKLSDSAPAFELPVGFAGGIPEPVTGLVRFGFRDYEPGTGRWVAKDPILFEGGQGNLYGYALNNPLYYRDSDGLQVVTLPGPIPLPIYIPIKQYSLTLQQKAQMHAFIKFIVNRFASPFMYKGGGVRPPGFWSGDKGAEEWGRRNGVGPDVGKRKFHDVKHGCGGSGPTEDLSVNPETGEVVDSNGEPVGNLDE